VTGDDVDYKGYIADALVRYKIGPGMSVAVEGYYASGGDADDTKEFGQWTYPSGSEAVWAMGNDRSIFFFYNGDFMYTAGKQLYAAGLYYGRLNFEYNPVPWVNLNFNAMYIGDTREGTPGTGKTVNMISSRGGVEAAQQYKDEDYVGTELNVIAKIKIYESLYYNVGFGYFMAGDVYDARNKSADDAYSLLTCLRYFF